MTLPSPSLSKTFLVRLSLLPSTYITHISPAASPSPIWIQLLFTSPLMVPVITFLTYQILPLTAFVFLLIILQQLIPLSPVSVCFLFLSSLLSPSIYHLPAFTSQHLHFQHLQSLGSLWTSDNAILKKTPPLTILKALAKWKGLKETKRYLELFRLSVLCGL